VLGGFFAGTALLVGFVFYELRAEHPMLPMRLFRHRSFSAINAASLLMLLGMFGSIFLLSQYLQTAGGYSPMQAGVRMLPWTAMPMIAGPLAGTLSDRIGRSTRRHGGHGPERRRPRTVGTHRRAARRLHPPAGFVHGLIPALWVGASAVALAAAVALLIPRQRKAGGPAAGLAAGSAPAGAPVTI